MKLTADLIATIVGAIASVLVEVIPGVKDVWANWKWKPLVLLGGFVVIPALLWVLTCPVGLDMGLPMDCTTQGLIQAMLLGFTAFGGNQAVFNLALRKHLVNIVKRNKSGS